MSMHDPVKGSRTACRGGILATLAATFLMCASPQAGAVLVFDDRSAWLASLAAGPDFVETFASFATDTAFGGDPLVTTNFTLRADNLLGPGVMFIDTPPLSGLSSSTFTTSNLVGFVDEDGVSFQMDFDSPLLAWGSDFSAARSGEGVAIEVAGMSIELATDDGFVGVLREAGDDPFSELLFRSADINPDDQLGLGEAFALDDVAGVLAPTRILTEAPTGLLAAMAILLLAGRRRIEVRRGGAG